MYTPSSSRYLTLALDIRKLTDSLIALVEEGKASQQLETSLKEVVASLENTGKETSVKSLRDRGSFGNYENVVTINEVVRPTDRATLITKLHDIISAETQQQRKESALASIEFFDRLERRALHHYSHPLRTEKTAATR